MIEMGDKRKISDAVMGVEHMARKTNGKTASAPVGGLGRRSANGLDAGNGVEELTRESRDGLLIESPSANGAGGYIESAGGEPDLRPVPVVRSGGDRQMPAAAADPFAKRSAVMLTFLLEFGPFVIAAFLLIFASLASNIPELGEIIPSSYVGVYVCLIFVALLGFVLRLIRQQTEVETRMKGVEAVTREAVSRIRPDIELLPLSEVFQRQSIRDSASECVRVFAITTRFVAQQLRSDAFKAERVELMVAGNNDDDPRVPLLAREVQLAIEYSWASQVRNRHIGRLRVRQYEFFPTEWYVIFDDRLMVLGSYQFDEDSVGCAAPLNAVLLVRDSGAGSELIQSKMAVFDSLFGAKKSERVGGGLYEGEYKLRHNKVARRVGSGKWKDLPGFSQTVPA